MSQNGRAVLAACGRIAADQYGVISREQAHGAGMSIDAIDRLIASGVWKRVHPRVYALWIPRENAGLWRHRLVAGALWLGSGSAASHRAAGVVWNMDGIDASPLEFSTTSERRSSEAGFLIHRVRRLTASELVVHQGIPVTTPKRTIMDLASVLTRGPLGLAVESARRMGLVDESQLSATLDDSGARPGSRTLRRILEQLPTRSTDSALEGIVWEIMLEHGLPRPERQYEIRDERGKLVARPDFAFVDARLAVEADGYGSHSSPRDFQRDRRRDNALTRLGWLVYKVTWNDATQRRDTVAAEITELLARRSRGKLA